MNYNKSEHTSSINVGIRIIPDNETLRLFLTVIDIINIPNLLMNTSKSIRFGVENAHILFYNEMDWEDKDGLNIKEGEVNIYLYDGKSSEIVLNENLFDKIIYDYSAKVLEIYKNDKSLSEKWFSDMEVSLDKLNDKILRKDIGINKSNVSDRKIIIYNFYDGLKLFNNLLSYNDWLSSTDFSIWSNSYIQVDDNKLYIIKENVKTLSTFSYYDKKQLMELSRKYDLEIKDENGVFYAFIKDYNSRQLEISENDNLVVIYSIEGSRSPERIIIYKVFKK